MISKKIARTIILGAAISLASSVCVFAQDANETPTPPRQSWSFSGPFGTFDQGQLQRGLKVYKEVCSNCHSLDYISFRNLADPGGPGYSVKQAESLAAGYQIKDGPNEKGEMFERPGRLADHFPSPFPNEATAKATYGIAPPDLSVMAKARGYERGFPWFVFDLFTQFQEEGPDYIHAILTGFTDPPKDFKVVEGKHYNKYFPGHNISMPPPLSDGQVVYDDGTKGTVDQYAKDVTAFLTWASEPTMEARKRIGLQVMIFLLVLSGLLYFTKKRVWSAVH
jgi:cytochrome c1